MEEIGRCMGGKSMAERSFEAMAMVMQYRQVGLAFGDGWAWPKCSLSTRTKHEGL
jgi:hypothetical protein